MDSVKNDAAPRAAGCSATTATSELGAGPDALSLRCAAIGARLGAVCGALLIFLGGLYLTGLLPSRQPWRESFRGLPGAPPEAAAFSWGDGHDLALIGLLALQLPVIVCLAFVAAHGIRARQRSLAGAALLILLIGVTALRGGALCR